MDRQFKTAFAALAAVSLCALAPVMGQAQQQDQADARTPAERGRELPKGLTLVPWKIDRSGKELLTGEPTAYGDGQGGNQGRSSRGADGG